MILTFGRFRGHNLRDVPLRYLLALLEKFEDNPAPRAASVNLTVSDIRDELQRREQDRKRGIR